MKSLDAEFLRRQPISHGLVQTIRLLGEYRGKHDLFVQQAPQVLDSLQDSARIESAESSNRIEGVTAPPERMKAILQKGGMPSNRSEQEIAGYRDVLATIHASYAYIPITTGIILQFHRDLYGFHTSSVGGHWKSANNEIAETHPDGSRVIRFTPTPAWQTPAAMEDLCDSFRGLKASGEFDTLLLIPAFVLDFLCIHPFLDGNGRMSRLLTLLLLYQAGYDVGRYISLERIVEQHKEGYYDTLGDASQEWHEGHHSLMRWWDYFLGVILLAAYREFESRVGVVTSLRGSKRELVIDVIRRLPPSFRFAEVERVCPDVSRPTIQRVFDELRRKGVLRSTGRGPLARWEKTGEAF